MCPSGRGPVNSPSRITLGNNGKIRPKPDRENAFARASGGERGIRTLDTVSRIHAFQACAFNHSATSPSQPFATVREAHLVYPAPDSKMFRSRVPQGILRAQGTALQEGANVRADRAAKLKQCGQAYGRRRPGAARQGGATRPAWNEREYGTGAYVRSARAYGGSDERLGAGTCRQSLGSNSRAAIALRPQPPYLRSEQRAVSTGTDGEGCR